MTEIRHFRLRVQRLRERDGRRLAALEVRILADKGKNLRHLAQRRLGAGVMSRPIVRGLAFHQHARTGRGFQCGKKGGQFLKRELSSVCFFHACGA